MIRTSRSLTTMLCVAGLSLALAGCSDNDAGDDASSPAHTSTVPTAPATAAPISEKLGELGTTFWAVQETATVAVDELNATCMEEAGFEYVPQLFVNVVVPEPGTLEFAEQYGYGIGTDLPIRYPTGMPAPDEKLAAYYTALYGEGYDLEASQPQGGCMATSWAAVWGDQVDSDLLDSVADMYGQAESSAGAAASAWSACMAEEGYEVDDLGDALDLVNEENAAGIEGFAESEIAMATADYTCRASSGVTAVQTEAFRELDAAYYAAHQNEVDALVVQIERIVNG